MSNAHRHRITNGVLWSAIDRFSVQGIQFLLSIVIARLISPSDYGLIAMLGIFLAIAQQFVDSGFSNALIQKKDRNEIDFSTVFYANLVIAIVIYAILFATAPLIASFYSVPELEPVAKWIGLMIILMAFSIVQRAKLTIELDFKKQAKISLVAVIVSGSFGVLLAWRGYGVWALVAQTLVNTFMNSLLLWIFAKWKLRFVFSWISFRTLFSFGSKLLIVGILHVFYTNIYTLIIGKKFNAADVGYFNRAQTLAMFPSVNISSIIARALYPVQCEMQGDDEALMQSLRSSLRISSFIVFPLMITLGILAKPIIQIILTDKWLPAAELLIILSVAYMFVPVRTMYWQILNVKGRSDLNLQVELLSKSVSLLILFASIPLGVKVICWGLFLSTLTDILILIPFVKKEFRIRYGAELRNLAPVLLLAIGTGCIIFASSQCLTSPGLKLLVGLIMGVISYWGGARLFKFPEILILTSLLKKKAL